MWGAVAWVTGYVRKGDAEQESWAGWVWKVASLWPVNGAVIKLWVGFWSQSLLAENKGHRLHCPRGREGAEGRGSGNPEPPIRLVRELCRHLRGHQLDGGKFLRGFNLELRGRC